MEIFDDKNMTKLYYMDGFDECCRPIIKSIHVYTENVLIYISSCDHPVYYTREACEQVWDGVAVKDMEYAIYTVVFMDGNRRLGYVGKSLYANEDYPVRMVGTYCEIVEVGGVHLYITTQSIRSVEIRKCAF